MAKGLDLVSEIYPRTGTQKAITIIGLKDFLIKDIAFLGTQTVVTDAAVTLELNDIKNAVINHCEFYGLATFISGGGIVRAVRSHLTIEQSKFLGSTAASGLYVPVVENVEWHGIVVNDTHFVDYGLRPGFFSKTGLGAPVSWINIGNAASPTSDSPRREVSIRRIFLDEGGYWGVSSLPDRYTPRSAPIDLVYITGLVMNVSNFQTSGHFLFGVEGVMVEKSHYKWSHNAYSSIDLRSVGNAILDHLTRVDHTDRIRADEKTQGLTIINSPQFTEFDSLAKTTKVITTETEEEDPVQYVRMRFQDTLAREPDPAGHFYWSDLLIRCEDDAQCLDKRRGALNEYLSATPSANFSVTGRVTNNGAPLQGATVTLSGSQSVTTTTNVTGDYAFSNLPTSGIYALATSKAQYTFSPETLITPTGDQVKNFTGIFSPYKITGRITTSAGAPLGGLKVGLTGMANAETTTNNSGNYFFTDLPKGSYTLTPLEASYVFSPLSRTLENLDADATADFTVVTYSVGGRITIKKGDAVTGVTVTLSGARHASTTTNQSGDYLFNDLPAGWNYTVTPAQNSYEFNPLNRTYNGLDADKSDDFLGIPAPVLIAEEDSDLAIALHALTLVTGPFNLEDDSIFAPGRRTRVTFFAKNVDLTPDDGVVTSAQAEDAVGMVYPLEIEFIGEVPDTNSLTQIIVILSRTLPQGGDLWLTIQQGTLVSNKVRISIASP